MDKICAFSILFVYLQVMVNVWCFPHISVTETGPVSNSDMSTIEVTESLIPNTTKLPNADEDKEVVESEVEREGKKLSHQRLLPPPFKSTTEPTKASKNVTDSDSDPAPEWGGKCTKGDWKKCSHVNDTWVTSYFVNPKKPELGFKYHETDCTIEKQLCLKNGYTVNRCHLLCMKCNKEFLTKYDKYVAKDGSCWHDLFP